MLLHYSLYSIEGQPEVLIYGAYPEGIRLIPFGMLDFGVQLAKITGSLGGL